MTKKKEQQRSSDPIPFIQVDRAVTAKASLLAQAIGVTTQHAKGSLVDWWELCGDPRDLERIIAETPEGQEPAVVLDGPDAALRFRLASGKECEPVVLARLGFLEELAGGLYRVRGMSRFFDVIRGRLAKRAAGRAGGLASASSRAETLGTSQPAASAAASTVVPVLRSVPEAAPKQRRSTAEATGNTEDRGQRTERGSTSSPLEQPRADGHEERPAGGLQGGEAFVAWARTQAPALAEPGPDVYSWADYVFTKYGDDVDAPLREAFCRWLVWCSTGNRTPGWGLWLRPQVWEPRLSDARAKTLAAGVA